MLPTRAHRCMIVDDHADMRALVRLILEDANDEITVGCEAASADEMLARIDECDPGVVVLDERMPGMSGIEAAALLRQQRPHQRFVLFSAHLNSRLRRRAAEIGIEVCLSKQHFHQLPAAVRAAAAA